MGGILWIRRQGRHGRHRQFRLWTAAFPRHCGYTVIEMDHPDRSTRRRSAARSATAVTLVEDQIYDGEHRRQPLRKQVVVGHAERDARVPDLALCAGQPALHCRHRNQERASDLLGAQPTERARRVSATCAASGSNGRRQVKISSSRSSGNVDSTISSSVAS
jgi:hypothetical protein